MQIGPLFRITATAWVATAVARVFLAVLPAGPPSHRGSIGAVPPAAGSSLVVAAGGGDGQG